MFIAYAVVGCLLALVLTASATFTLQRNDQVVASMQKVRVPDSWLPRLATLKAAGALGLVAGLWVTPLGVAAAAGVTSTSSARSSATSGSRTTSSHRRPSSR